MRNHDLDFATRKNELFRQHFSEMLDEFYPLVKLSKLIEWKRFDEEFGTQFSEKGRPATPTRVMVGLHYLKHAFNVSDEEVVERFMENPFWILGIQAVHGRPFDGHTLPGAIEQAERITGIRIEEIYVDKGYQGAKKLLPERKSI